MAVGRGLASSTLVEVIDRILDKGLVIDFWVTVALIGIEIVSVEGRVVVSSVETYLKYAEAMGLASGA
jgi:gas vesicle structural protein